jgi:hypothetical protein
MARIKPANPSQFASMQQLRSVNPIDSLLQTMEYFSNVNERDKTEVASSLNGLNNLINASMTDEQIANAEMAVSNLDERASGYGETDLQHQALAFSVQNKRNAYNDYRDAVDATADFIDSDLYITKAEDWQDLDALYKNKTNAEGKPMYDSVADMIVQEYSRLGTLQARASAGREAGFYYKGAVGKNKEFEEGDVIEKMLVYQNRLDKAMESLIGDETITQEEASLIMQGIDRKGFISFRNNKVSNIERELVSEKNNLQSIKDMILKEEYGQDDMDFLRNLANNSDDPNERDLAQKGILSFMNGKNEGLVDALEKLEFDSNVKLNKHRRSYKSWMGTDYADIATSGGESFFEFANELGETTYIDPEGETEETEEYVPGKGTKEEIEKSYAERHNLPPNPTEKAQEEPKSVGEQFMYNAVNKNISQEEWNATIDGMDEWDSKWVGPTKGMFFGAGKTGRELKSFVKNMYGKKLLSLDEWKEMTKGAKTGAGYPQEYKNYVNAYNQVSTLMDEYLNPAEIQTSTMDEFLSTNMTVATATKSVLSANLDTGRDKPVGKRRVKLTNPGPGAKKKLNNIRKLYRQSGLTLEEFKKQYKTEYLNMVRLLKYAHTLKQSHYKIGPFYGKQATN